MKLKNITKYILALILILSVLPINFVYSAEEEPRFEPAEYTEEITFLTELGLLNPEKQANVKSRITIARSELAELAVTIMGADASIKGEARFKDVPDTHPQFSDISWAVTLGLMSGKSADTFEPETPLTMKEAVKVAICMLGYGARAEIEGGYPDGYLKIAQKLGITKGVSVSSEKAALRGEVLRLMCNTVTTNMVINEGISGDGTKEIGYTYKDRNILSEIHNIYKYEAVFEADEYSSIIGGKTDNGFVRVGGVIYKNLSSAAYGKLGKNVEIYYRNDDSIPEILSLREKNNKEIVIKSNSEYSLDFIEGIYTLNEGGERHKFKIGKEYNLIYNDEPIDGSNEVLMKPNSGSIKLIDNNNDGLYNIIIVDEYYNLIVNMYNSFNNTIYDFRDMSLNLNLDDFDVVTFREDGEVVLPQNIVKDSVLSVKKSLKSDKTEVLVSTEKKRGVLTMIDEKDVTIGRNTYTLSNELRADASDLKLGREYTVYLDGFGEIAYFNETQQRETACFLAAAPLSGLNASMALKLLMPNGKIGYVETAKAVKIISYNDQRKMKANEITPYLTEKQLIMYERNDEGLVDAIVLPYSASTQTEYNAISNYPLIKMDYIINEWPDLEGSKTVKYGRYDRNFDSWMVLDEKALIYCVPPTGTSEYTDANVGMISISDLFNDSSVPFVVNGTVTGLLNEFDAYSVNNNKLSTDVLVYYTNSVNQTFVEDQAMAIVTNVTYKRDDTDDSFYPVLELNDSGKIKNLIVDDETLIYRESLTEVAMGTKMPSLSSNKVRIKSGDMIKYTTDSSTGRPKSIALLYDMENDKLCYDFASRGATFRLIRAEVMRKDGMLVEFKVKNKLERTSLSASTKVYVYDKAEKSTYPASTNDICPGDQVVVYSRLYANNIVVIIKK